MALCSSINSGSRRLSTTEHDTAISMSATTSSDISAIYQVTRQSFNCQHFCYDRTPKGKSSLLIFVLNVIENFAFFCAVDGAINLIFKHVQSSDIGSVISLALQSSLGRIAYPFAGFAADVYLGRYGVIHIGLWLLLTAHCLLAITVSLTGYITITGEYVLGVVAYVFVSAGSASFEANVIPFGVDQLSPGPSSAEMSSYFYWYYFGRQLGAVLSFVVFILLTIILNVYKISEESSFYTALTSLPSVLTVLLLVIAILLHSYLKNWYFRDVARPNPLKLVINVLWYAATVKRQFPRYRRAFRYGERWKPRIELAKIDYDGIYDRGDVEDVKTICRLLLVFFSLCGYSITYHGAFIMLSFQSSHLFNNITKPDTSLQTYLNVPFLCNALTVMACLPILNHLVIPCLPDLSMKKRIGLGIAFGVSAVAVAAVLEAEVHKESFKTQLLWGLLPTVLLAVSEVLVSVTILEFIYAQTPESAKGLLTGAFYFLDGIFNIGGLILFYFILHDYPLDFPNKTTLNKLNPVLWYYVMLCGIGAVGFVMYTVTACIYTNRQRPNLPDDEISFTRRRYAGIWSSL